MAYSESFADRIRNYFVDHIPHWEEKKMMGGLCFMVNDKMCVGLTDDNLMARIGPEAYEEALKKRGCHEMDFTGRPMKGFVFVHTEALKAHADLHYWLQLCLDYNPHAQSSKKRTTKKAKET